MVKEHEAQPGHRDRPGLATADDVSSEEGTRWPVATASNQMRSKLFRPDPRNRRHQRYCSVERLQGGQQSRQPTCWLSAPENQGYFRGPVNVARVQAWRSRHPGYWR